MKYRISPQVYLYDYGRLFMSCAVTAAITFIVYTILFGGMW